MVLSPFEYNKKQNVVKKEKEDKKEEIQIFINVCIIIFILTILYVIYLVGKISLFLLLIFLCWIFIAGCLLYHIFTSRIIQEKDDYENGYEYV